jgi:2-C-methyl-D-erythritol 4-phosphate cytidylyltransferase
MNIAIIPARKNSRRIKNKNIKIFNGKPIIYWSIKTAIKSKLFESVLEFIEYPPPISTIFIVLIPFTSAISNIDLVFSMESL